MRKLRLFLAVVLLAASLYLLIWGFAPARRETIQRTIPPAELQLPTPSSLHPDLEPVC